MEIIRPDWESIDLYHGRYGAHLFEKERGLARIYIHDGLDALPGNDMKEKFHRKNSHGVVGHCLIVFYGVKRFDLVVSPYSDIGENGEGIVWHPDIEFKYVGDDYPNTNEYEFIGSLHGMFAPVSVEIEAQGFEIHIYGKDEPYLEALLPATDK
jgi:hypothetical protein